MLGFAFPGLSGKVNGGATGIKNGPLMSKIHPALESSLIPIKQLKLTRHINSQSPLTSPATAFSPSLIVRPQLYPITVHEGQTVALFVSSFQFHQHKKYRAIIFPDLPLTSLIPEKHAPRVIFTF